MPFRPAQLFAFLWQAGLCRETEAAAAAEVVAAVVAITSAQAEVEEVVTNAMAVVAAATTVGLPGCPLYPFTALHLEERTLGPGPISTAAKNGGER